MYNDVMTKKLTTPVAYVQPYRYPSPNIPMTAIRRFARQIAERFRPEKIILFGSYAYGKPHNESDVDLLVIMPARNVIDQSIRIGLAFKRPFSFDLIVRTPKQVERGVRDDDWFLREITEKGKVLYEAPHRSMASKGGGRLGRGATSPHEDRLYATSHVSIASKRRRSTSKHCSRKTAPSSQERMTWKTFSTCFCPTTGRLHRSAEV
jgi:uncharacterized protein